MSEEEKIKQRPEDGKTESLEENVNENISSPETIEKIETQIETSDITTSDIQNMETHAHDLHKAPGHGWTHYFFEFFMLFLAVFCGFLAENQREHYVEKEREKQFILSFIEDLKLDTAGLARNIGFKKQRQLNIDTALFPLTKLQGSDLMLRVCINLGNVLSNPYFFSNDGTIQQLKGSGGMRLIRNRKAVDSIASYDFQIRRIMLRQENGAVADNEYNRIFNNFIPAKTIFSEISDSLYRQKAYDPQKIIKINTVYLNELTNQLIDISGNNSFEIGLYTDIKYKAENIITFLRKEYQLQENE
jgi:hypothetical protein